MRITLLPLTYQQDGEKLFRQVNDLPYSCWLDSGKPASKSGRFDIMAALPLKRFVSNGQVTQEYHRLRDKSQYRDTHIDTHKGDPFTCLQNELAQYAVTRESEIPFTGGAIGYFAYDLGGALHAIDNLSKPRSAMPDMHIGIYHWAVVQDHHKQQAYLVYTDQCCQDDIELLTDRLEATADNRAAFNQAFNVSGLQKTIEPHQYHKQIQVIKDYLLAGDCYQVNFAQCFIGKYSGEPYSAYRRLRKKMASPFSAYLSLGKQAILSLSPERFIQLKGRRVLTQPIKGTSPRDSEPLADQIRAQNLLASEKNRAENVMIVDLLRNDLGHHCIPGSITVENLFGLQSFPNVHHLVSDISGELKPDTNALNLLRDSFPGGSITGAPKKRSMEIIDELELRSRGVYCGSIGYISFCGDMDTNIAIRSVSCDGEYLYCWGGGGIVYDSDPEEEYQESINKIRLIIDTLQQQ